MIENNRKIALSVLIIIACFGLLSSCRTFQTDEDCRGELDKVVSNLKLDDTIDIGQTTNCFKWDSVMILSPAYSPAKVEEESGVILPVELKGDIVVETSYWTMVFTKKKKAVNVIKISRKHMEFGDLNKAMGGSKWGFFFIPRKNLMLGITLDEEQRFVNGDPIYQARIIEKN